MAESVYVINLVLSIGGMFLLSLVLLILIKSSEHGHILLRNMVVTSLCHVVSFIALWSANIRHHNERIYLERIYLERILFIVCCCFYFALIFGIFGVTTDRFIACYRPFRYRVIVTRSRIYRFLIITWALSISTRIPFLVWPLISLRLMIIMDTSLAFLFVVMQPITYFYIYRKRRARRQKLRKYWPSSGYRNNRPTQKRFLRTSLLLGSVCLLQISVDFTYNKFGLTLPSCNKSVMSYLSQILWIVFVTMAPVIYVFLMPETIRFIISIFRKQKPPINDNTITNSASYLKVAETMI